MASLEADLRAEGEGGQVDDGAGPRLRRLRQGGIEEIAHEGERGGDRRRAPEAPVTPPVREERPPEQPLGGKRIGPDIVGDGRGVAEIEPPERLISLLPSCCAVSCSFWRASCSRFSE